MDAFATPQQQNYMTIGDFPRMLREGQIDFAELSLLQRMLMMTDGTLTKMLETYTQEYLDVVKLSEEKVTLTHDIVPMRLFAGDEVSERKILLKGRSSRRNWLYAESIIVPERLPAEFQRQLVETRLPIGKLWKKYKLETFKEILCYCRESAENVFFYFDLHHTDPVLSRTYVAHSGGKPIMLITEKFPERYFI